MLLNELLRGISGIEPGDYPETRVEGVAYDSRRVKRGDLFVGIKGEKTDGTRFVPQAIERGASAVATEESFGERLSIPTIRVPDARRFLAEAARIFYHDPAAQMTLVAITGTNGKTTTSYLVDAVFRQAGLRSCLLGTTGIWIGRQQFPCDRTTPESPDLQLFLRHAVMGGCTHGALEVSSHALFLSRVYGTRFTVGVFTNLTQDHLDFHHDMESYYRAKRMLFTDEGRNAIEKAVINTDDPYGRRLMSEAAGPVLSYGFDPAADIRATASCERADGTDMAVQTPGGTMTMATKLLGRPNVYNVLAAIGASVAAGMDLESIRLGIEGVEGVPGRMERITAGQPFQVIVDYAHTPDALEKLLATLRSLPHRRLITVFGCGGDRDRGKRPVMGEIAARLSDRVIVTSDNPRTEDPLAILEEIREGLRKGTAACEMVENRRDAIALAIDEAQDGDTVVIAGKGHENYQIIGTRIFPFDDRSVARDVIRKLPDSRATRY